jgi:hypothetical protein
MLSGHLRPAATVAAGALAFATVGAPSNAYGSDTETCSAYEVGSLEVHICAEFESGGKLYTTWYVQNNSYDSVTMRITVAWQRWNKPWHWVHDQTETLAYGQEDNGVVGTQIGCGDHERFHGGIVINYDGNYRTSPAVTDSC